MPMHRVTATLSEPLTRTFVIDVETETDDPEEIKEAAREAMESNPEILNVTDLHREDYDMDSWTVEDVTPIDPEAAETIFRFFLTPDEFQQIATTTGLDAHLQDLIRRDGRTHTVTDVHYSFVGAGPLGAELQATYTPAGADGAEPGDTLLEHPSLFAPGGIDWNALWQSKKTLIRLAGDDSLSGPDQEAMDSLISLIDAVQDEAILLHGTPKDEVTWYLKPEHRAAEGIDDDGDPQVSASLRMTDQVSDT